MGVTRRGGLPRLAAVVPGGGGRGGFGCRLTLPLWCLKGWLAFFAACLPCLQFIFCPLSPRPPSPAGKGEIFSFLMQGASPLAFPGLNPGGTGAGGVSRAGGGACPASPARLAAAVSGGELAFFVACQPRLYLLFCPLSPRPPSPAGKGEIFLLSYARGFAPCIPEAEPAVRRKTDRISLP